MHDQLTLFDLTPGKVLGGRFEIQRQSRQGGLSAAFAVRDQTSGADCELQLFPPALFESDDEAGDFARSWEPWKQVGSVALAATLDVVQLDAGNLALITALPAGRSLRALLEEGRRLDEAEALRLGLDLCTGLTELHGMGLAHGDIKPNTIWVADGEGALSPCLVDGGVTAALWSAKHLGEQTALIGTPYYAPVEQFGGSAPDARSDVYNLCTVLYELATGRRTFDTPGLAQLMMAKAQGRFDPPRSLRPDLPAGMARVLSPAGIEVQVRLHEAAAALLLACARR